jgi:peroxidase
MDNDTTSLLVPEADFQQARCRQLPRIVRAAVRAAVRRDIKITAGLLRIFFHDCFPQGCDASIFLDPERRFGPNASLQPRAEQLVEDIRARVHGACGPAVSCADILALATRVAVKLAGGPFYSLRLGRRDSLRPPSSDEISMLPGPSTNVNSLLRLFGSRGLGDPADLVALSGGHTVGKASCRFIRADDEFSKRLARQCSARPARKQNLDVITPNAFDNRYFVALTRKLGVLASDQGLFNHRRTRPLVNAFARDQSAFFNQFATSMFKMSNIRGSGAGEIRRNCFRPNRRPVSLDLDDDAPGGTEDEGLAASA